MNTETKSFIYYLLMTLLAGVATILFFADIFIYKNATIFSYVGGIISALAYLRSHYKVLKSIK